MSDLKTRFAALKKKHVEISIQNRKDVVKEEKRKPVQAEVEEESGPSNSRRQLLNYTVEEYENWEAKQAQKRRNKEASSYGDLAKMTYEKEIRELEKQKLSKVEERESSLNSDGKLVVKDDQSRVDLLVNTSKGMAGKRYKMKQNKVTKSGSYVNDKNRQFNDKLERTMGDQ